MAPYTIPSDSSVFVGVTITKFTISMNTILLCDTKVTVERDPHKQQNIKIKFYTNVLT